MFPHCDQRILHAPGECEYCDEHTDWQKLRQVWGIAFTGHAPDGVWIKMPCPADASRPAGARNDHRRWGGNKPTKAEGDPRWPAESFASVMLYGDKGGRQPWPIRERIYRLVTSPFYDLKMRLRGFHKEEGFWHYP